MLGNHHQANLSILEFSVEHTTSAGYTYCEKLELLFTIICFQVFNMRKGRRNWKKNPSSFKKGHASFYTRSVSADGIKTRKRVKRLTEKEFSRAVQAKEQGVLTCQDEEGARIDSILLRPSPKKANYWDTYNSQDSNGNEDTYTIVHWKRSAQMWNSEIRSHMRARPSCEGYLNWDDELSEKRGLCWAVVLKCSICKYKSVKYKLYDEIPADSRGRKCAGPNAAIQVGLARLGLSSTGLHELMATINMTPPSLSGLQYLANKINPQLVEINKDDMAERISSLTELNEKKGLSNSTSINIEADATYNNRLNSGVGKTPTQPATQATYLVAENMTKEKDIIHVGTYNKLCTCPRNDQGVKQHHSTCTANLPEDAIIGNEGKYLQDAIIEINKQGASINYVTLDGDSNANSAGPDILQSSKPEQEVKPLRCTIHLTRTMEKHIKNSKFSNSMFPGKQKAVRQKAQVRFAFDIGKRCTAEFKALCEEYEGDLDTIINRASYLIDAIINCYEGNCDNCRKYSFVCKESTHTFKWKRPYLRSLNTDNTERIFIKPTTKDRTTLKKCLEMRLGKKNVKKTFLNTTQNKCEGANRGLSKGVPKHLTFARNYPGRVHACVHSMNNGPGTSITKLCSAIGAPITPNSKVSRTLQRMDLTKDNHKKRKLSAQYRNRRAKFRDKNFLNYDSKQAEACYSKGLDDKDATSQRTLKSTCTENNITQYNTRSRRERLQTSTVTLDHNYLVSATPTNEHAYSKEH